MFDTSHARKLYAACGYGVHEMRVARLCNLAPQLSDEFFISSHNACAAQRKMRRAHWVGRALTLVPWIRAVAVCNSLALGMVHEESDIDLFIVAAAGRVWAARFFVTTLLTCARLRPGEAANDPVCASFFIDETVKDFAPFKIEQDVYFYFWERSLLPLFGTHETCARGGVLPSPFVVRAGAYARAVQRVGELLVACIPEKIFWHAQLKMFPRVVHEACAKNDKSVMWSATYIKLHTADRRAELSQKIV